MEKEKFKKQVEADQIRLQRIYEGNEREFNRLFNECRSLISIWHSRYIYLPIEDIESAFSDASMICYSNIRAGKLGLLSGRLKDYISGIMRYKLYDINASTKNLIPIEDTVITDYPYTPEDDGNIKMRIVVNKYVNQMKEPCKTILEKFYLDGLSYDKILSLLPNFTSLRAIVTQSYKCKKQITEDFATTLKNNDVDLYRYKN